MHKISYSNLQNQCFEIVEQQAKLMNYYKQFILNGREKIVKDSREYKTTRYISFPNIYKFSIEKRKTIVMVPSYIKLILQLDQ